MRFLEILFRDQQVRRAVIDQAVESTADVVVGYNNLADKLAYEIAKRKIAKEQNK